MMFAQYILLEVKAMAFQMRMILFAGFIIFFTQSVFANFADPDSISMGYEYYGSPAVKAGDYVEYHGCRLGGFIETRNEDRFEQGPLPNHNWRGFGFLRYNHLLYKGEMNSLNIVTGAEHESAHPTGGFHENNDEAYEMIYDGLYRNINLNSIMLGFSGITVGRVRFRYNADYRLYVYSRNTPELHDNTLTHGHGFSGGLELYVGILPTVDLYLSLFDRYIFKGDKHRPGWIYYDEGGAAVKRYESYPIINEVNTFVLKTGILIHRTDGKRTLSIYGKMLYGNIYGFVDSRDERLRFSVGMEITR